MRLLLCGGGTAGHISPAIAIAEELKRSHPDSDILFVGRDGGSENDAILKRGHTLKTIKIEGLKRSLSIDNIRRVLKAFESKNKAEEIIRDFNPDVILGTGGYVCWPIISVGRKMKIPVAIHESNLSPGLTTKMLAGRCNRVFLNHAETKKQLKNGTHAVTVGNPLITDFGKLSRADSRKKLGIAPSDFFILSFGGSIGSEQMNRTIIEVMNSFSSKDSKVRHLHATGKRYFKILKSQYIDREINGCKILPYIDNMPIALSAADLVICRCGAMTLSELSAVGVPAILIPSPNVSNNHQYKNARYLADSGAAEIIEEKHLTSEALEKAIIKLKNDKNERKTRAKNIKALATPDAAKRIINELFIIKKQP